MQRKYSQDQNHLSRHDYSQSPLYVDGGMMLYPEFRHGG